MTVELIDEALGDLGLDVLEERVADFDDDDDPGEFAFGDLDELFGIVDLVGLRGDVGTAGRTGAAGDEEVAGGVGLGGVFGGVDFNGVGVLAEAGVAVEEVDVVAMQLVLDGGVLAFDELGNAKHQIFNLDLCFDAVAAAVEGALAKAAQEKDGFAESVAGDGAGVRAGAAEVGGRCR